MMALSPVDIYSNIGTYTLVWPDDGSTDTDIQYNTINDYKVEVFGAGKLRKLDIYWDRIVALAQNQQQFNIKEIGTYGLIHFKYPTTKAVPLTETKTVLLMI